MIAADNMKTGPLALLTVTPALLAGGSTNTLAAGEAPVKEILSRSVGWEVDKTTKGDVCTVESHHECGEGIALSTANPRVSNILKASAPTRTRRARASATSTSGRGATVGWTCSRRPENSFWRSARTSTALTHGNVCTKASKDVCGAGVEGTAAGQFQNIQSLSVDPSDGYLYIKEGGANQRVERYSPEGQFVWMSGKEVDKTATAIVKALEAKGETPTPAQIEAENLCTAASGDECQAGTRDETGQSAFDGLNGRQNEIAAGGPEDLLYIGDKPEGAGARSRWPVEACGAPARYREGARGR